MSMDTSALPFAKPMPSSLTRGWKKAATQTALDKAYAIVNAREDNRCQVTGVPLTPFARNAKRCREHHHLKGRRVQPSWREDPRRIVLCSRYVHELLQAGVLLTDETDARKPLNCYWNPRMVRAGAEPFRLRRTA